jgi:hypothetical protein
MVKTFNEWVQIQEGTIWEDHKSNLPSIFTRTYYALPTTEQVEEFEKYPNLTAEEIVQGFGYTIVGRGVNSPENSKKIIESIRMLVDRYPDREEYKEALAQAKERAREKFGR